MEQITPEQNEPAPTEQTEQKAPAYQITPVQMARFELMLNNMLNKLTHQYITLHTRKDIRRALAIIKYPLPRGLALLITQDAQSKASELYEQLTTFYSTPTANITINTRRMLHGLFVEVAGSMKAYLESIHAPRYTGNSLLDIVNAYIPLDVEHSIFMMGKKITVAVDAIDRVDAIRKQIVDALAALEETSYDINVVYKDNGQIFEK